MEAAKKALSSTLHKEEKALETMKAKNVRQWQLDRLAADVKHHKTMLALLENAPVPREDLDAALAAIPGYIEKIQKILPKFQPGTSQHTLGIRRIEAYRTAQALVQSLLSTKGPLV